jgi:type IV pilus secretin PilQ/predicted competence protein
MEGRVMRIRTRAILAGMLFFYGVFLSAAPSLITIKKGSEGDRYWAAFVFDGSAKWLSISQARNGAYSIFFSGDAKRKDGERLTMDDGRCIIGIQQVKRNPAVFKATVQCDAAYPVAVVRRSNTVVIGLNDSRLLSQSGKAASLENQYVELISVIETPSGSGKETRFEFSEQFDWMGFFKNSTGQATFLFAGVSNMSPVDSYAMNNNVVRNVRLMTDYENPSVMKAAVDFSPNAAYTIIHKGQALVISGGTDAKSSNDDASLVQGLLKQDEESLASWDDEGFSGTTLYNEDDLFAREQSGASSSSSQPASNTPAAHIPVQEWTMPTYNDGSKNSSIPWNQIVSFEFPGTPIQDALRLIAASNNLNMVIGEDVRATVVMDLKNVTLRQALDQLLHTHDMEYIVEGDIITVKSVKKSYTGGVQTKVYRLKYADAHNVLNVIRRVASSDSSVEVFSTEFLNYATSGLKRKEAAGVGVQGIQRSSMLVVTDRPEKIREIDAIIKELDQAPVQIMIESKLVEVAPYYSEELGIDWDKTLGMYMQDNREETSETGKQKFFQIFNESDNLRYENTWKVGRLTAAQYLAVLDVLKEKTDATLRLNPRILAMNDEESSISVGTTVPIPEIQQAIGGAGGQERVTFRYKEVNIQLNVTPHVGQEGEIIMYVNPIIEEISDWVEFGGQRAPVTAKRMVNSIVSIRNGETIVIGGLIKNQKTRTTKKVWLLGNLPLVGRLFQHSAVEDKQTDLMIFITPTIVEG